MEHQQVPTHQSGHLCYKIKRFGGLFVFSETYTMNENFISLGDECQLMEKYNRHSPTVTPSSIGRCPKQTPNVGIAHDLS